MQVAEPCRPLAALVDGLDLDGGETLDARALRLEQAAKRQRPAVVAG